MADKEHKEVNDQDKKKPEVEQVENVAANKDEQEVEQDDRTTEEVLLSNWMG